MNNLKEGFSIVYSVQNNSFVNAKCTKCDKSIRNGVLALIGNCFNTKHRGNETEYNIFFHRKCSETNNEWTMYDEEVKTERLKERKRKSILKKIAKLEDGLVRIDI